MKHGSATTYQHHGCRCRECCAAATEKMREWRRKIRQAGPPPGVQHGLDSTYVNYKCRCEPCRDARTQYLIRYYTAKGAS